MCLNNYIGYILIIRVYTNQNKWKFKINRKAKQTFSFAFDALSTPKEKRICLLKYKNVVIFFLIHKF